MSSGRNNQINNKIQNYFPEIPAKFLAELQDQTVLESDKAVLTCKTNKANVKVVWYKNNKKIKASDKYSISTDGADHSLSINDLKTDDAATYMVKAGDLSCEAKVEVKGQCLCYFLWFLFHS